MADQNNVVNLAAALDLARRELKEKAPSRSFWRADAAELNDALDSVDSELIQTTLNEIATGGVNSDRSRELRNEVKRRLAESGFNRYACAGVSCALAHAARRTVVNR